MTLFHYRAAHKTGRIQSGSLQTANENDLAAHLFASGLELIEAKKARTPSLFTARKTASQAEKLAFLSTFCRQTGRLLKSGLTFDEALEIVSLSLPTPRFQGALRDIHRALQSGASLAKSFAHHTDLFPKIMIASLAAGEASGDLPTIFERLTHHFERQEKRHQARNRISGPYCSQCQRILRFPYRPQQQDKDHLHRDVQREEGE